MGGHTIHLVAVLENCRDALTTTDAHGNERVALVGALQLVERAKQQGIPFRAVGADAFYGEDRGFRLWCIAWD